MCSNQLNRRDLGFVELTGWLVYIKHTQACLVALCDTLAQKDFIRDPCNRICVRPFQLCWSSSKAVASSLTSLRLPFVSWKQYLFLDSYKHVTFSHSSVFISREEVFSSSTNWETKMRTYLNWLFEKLVLEFNPVFPLGIRIKIRIMKWWNKFLVLE